jgi:hypothetical protein
VDYQVDLEVEFAEVIEAQSSDTYADEDDDAPNADADCRIGACAETGNLERDSESVGGSSGDAGSGHDATATLGTISVGAQYFSPKLIQKSDLT